MNKPKFPLVFSLLFSIIGLIVGIWISQTTSNNDYSYFYVYSTLAGFITAWILSKYFIDKKNNYTNTRLIIVGILVGLLSHWLCWYLITLEMNFRYWVLAEYFSSPPINPLFGIAGVFVFCLYSWVFFGWATIIGGIVSIYSTQRILKINI